ncbi:hypothetical protein [Microvirga sp. BSC39]|nr:hypothetical protein [Microvirga sp. BSC39]
MKRVSLTPSHRGPETKRAERKRVEMIAELSKHCGWAKPVVKIPKDKHQ